jgi:hypothetical protein
MGANIWAAAGLTTSANNRQIRGMARHQGMAFFPLRFLLDQYSQNLRVAIPHGYNMPRASVGTILRRRARAFFVTSIHLKRHRLQLQWQAMPFHKKSF